MEQFEKYGVGFFLFSSHCNYRDKNLETKKKDAAPTEIKARLKQASTLNAIDKVAVLFLPSRMNAKLQTVVAPRGSLRGARGL